MGFGCPIFFGKIFFPHPSRRILHWRTLDTRGEAFSLSLSLFFADISGILLRVVVPFSSVARRSPWLSSCRQLFPEIRKLYTLLGRTETSSSIPRGRGRGERLSARWIFPTFLHLLLSSRRVHYTIELCCCMQWLSDLAAFSQVTT